MTWNEFLTWELVLPPSRPSGAQLETIKRHLRGVDRRAPILVLGSTVEFRDLLAIMGFRAVTVVDSSADYFHRSAGALTTPNPYGESFVELDWMDFLHETDELYTVVLSDLTLGNLNYERQSHFYAAIAGRMANNAVLFDKVLLHGPTIPTLPVQLARFRNSPPNLANVNRFNCAVLFNSSILTDGILDTTVAYRELELATRTDPHLAAYVDRCKRVTPPGAVWYYGKRQFDFWEVAGTVLELESHRVEGGRSPYSGILHFIVWRKRNV
jgi:hypothetical protein